VEIDYNTQIARRLSVRPTLQYVIRPGGRAPGTSRIVGFRLVYKRDVLTNDNMDIDNMMRVKRRERQFRLSRWPPDGIRAFQPFRVHCLCLAVQKR